MLLFGFAASLIFSVLVPAMLKTTAVALLDLTHWSTQPSIELLNVSGKMFTTS